MVNGRSKRSIKKMLILSVVVILVIACLYGCLIGDVRRDRKRTEYYSDLSHYLPAVATIKEWSIKKNLISIRVFNYPKEYYSYSADDSCFFCITGANVDIVKKNGIETMLEIGKDIEFVSAPEIFWSGYMRPIVALTIDGVILLTQEEGVANYLKTI